MVDLELTLRLRVARDLLFGSDQAQEKDHPNLNRLRQEAWNMVSSKLKVGGYRDEKSLYADCEQYLEAVATSQCKVLRRKQKSAILLAKRVTDRKQNSQSEEVSRHKSADPFNDAETERNFLASNASNGSSWSNTGLDEKSSASFAIQFCVCLLHVGTNHLSKLR